MTRVGSESSPEAVLRSSLTLTARRFARFALVGVVGFAIEAAVITALASGAGMNLYAARGVSFLSAVFVTWLLNRTLTFVVQRGDEARVGPTAEYARYLTVQTVGALGNLAVFVAVIHSAPSLAFTPIVPLAIGAVAGLTVNFAGSQWWVFRGRSR